MSDRIQSWREYAVKVKGLLPKSLALYERTLEILEQDCGEISDLDEDTLLAWLLKRAETAPSASSYSNRLSALRSFYRWQVRTGLRDIDPTLNIEAPKRHKGIPKPIPGFEAKLALLDDVDRKARETGAAPTRRIGQTRDMAIFLSETGLRIHEAVKCDWPVPCPDIGFVLGKGAKDAVIPLTDEARAAWDRLGGKWPCGIRATQRRFEKADFTPHQLRHHLGCTLGAGGADLGEIQDLLRHSSPATTRGYTAYAMSRLRAAHERRRGVQL